MSTYGTAALDALADPTRRSVLELVAQRPRSVTELAAALPVSRPAVSQHLRVLKHANLVVDQPVGTRRVYRLDTRGLTELRAYVDQMWRTALASFAAYTEQQYGTDPSTPGGEPDDRAPR